MSSPVKWLLLEGLIPLLGAAFLYVAWGACRYVVAANKTGFQHDWKAALDPIGWLYGGAVLAAQAGAKCVGTGSPILVSMCFGAAAVCLLILIAAMSERASDAAWQSPPSLRWSAVVLVVGILYAGYTVAETTGQPEPPQNTGSKP